MPPQPGAFFPSGPPPMPSHVWVGGARRPDDFMPDSYTHQDWSNKCDQFLQRVSGGAPSADLSAGMNIAATSASTKSTNDRRLDMENG